MIAIMIGLIRAYIQQKQQQQQQDQEEQEEQEEATTSTTTLARYRFEHADKKLNCTKELYRRIATTDNYVAINDITNQLDIAAQHWAYALNHVLQTKRRARSPSPASQALYERFMPVT